ncbi:MAG: pyruvate formate-lyase-activating protein [Nocardioidaceae bacterium]
MTLTDPDVDKGPAVDAPRPVEGTMHSWDISTGVDGPGTRFVLFTSGCPLRCLYCHNPDTWWMRSGERVTDEQVLARIARYVPYLRAAGGGVTVSGGEPLLQPEFTGAVLAGARACGLHTALDTAGSLGDRADDDLLDATDLVLLDIKAADEHLYRRLTGGALTPTLRFAERLAERGQATWVRFVLVPGVTDAPEHVRRLATFVAGLPNVERVDVLGYHRLGREKYAALGLRDRLRDVPGATPEQVVAARRAFAEAGLAVT